MSLCLRLASDGRKCINPEGHPGDHDYRSVNNSAPAPKGFDCHPNGPCPSDTPCDCEAMDRLYSDKSERPAPLPGKVPTHRCKVCGALWRLNPALDPKQTGMPTDYPLHSETWSLVSPACGKCCDNAPMGDQIEPLPLSLDSAADSADTVARRALRCLLPRPQLPELAAAEHSIACKALPHGCSAVTALVLQREGIARTLALLAVVDYLESLREDMRTGKKISHDAITVLDAIEERIDEIGKGIE